VSFKAATFLLVIAAAGFIAGCGMKGGYPGSTTGATAGVMIVYREAIALIDKLEFGPAAVKLERVVAQFDAAQDVVHTPKAMFWLGFCREKLGLDDSARRAYVEVIERFGDSIPAKHARRRLDAMNEP